MSIVDPRKSTPPFAIPPSHHSRHATHAGDVWRWHLMRHGVIDRAHARSILHT